MADGHLRAKGVLWLDLEALASGLHQSRSLQVAMIGGSSGAISTNIIQAYRPEQNRGPQDHTKHKDPTNHGFWNIPLS